MPLDVCGTEALLAILHMKVIKVIKVIKVTHDKEYAISKYADRQDLNYLVNLQMGRAIAQPCQMIGDDV
jgi:hypothetical protein